MTLEIDSGWITANRKYAPGLVPVNALVSIKWNSFPLVIRPFASQRRLFVEVNYADPPGRDAFLSKIFRNKSTRSTQPLL